MNADKYTATAALEVDEVEELIDEGRIQEDAVKFAIKTNRARLRAFRTLGALADLQAELSEPQMSLYGTEARRDALKRFTSLAMTLDHQAGKAWGIRIVVALVDATGFPISVLSADQEVLAQSMQRDGLRTRVEVVPDGDGPVGQAVREVAAAVNAAADAADAEESAEEGDA